MNLRGFCRAFTIITILVSLSHCLFADTGPFHAVIWDESNGLTDLGTFGGLESRAYDVNDNGVVVGYAQTETGQWHAALWLPIPEPSSLFLFLMIPLFLRNNLKKRIIIDRNKFNYLFAVLFGWMTC